MLKIEQDEAKELLKNFFLGIPKIADLMDKAQAYVLHHGRIYEAVFGRSRFTDKWKLNIQGEQSGIARGASNFIIQAAGASITKIAVILFQRWINNNQLNDKVKLLLAVHDKILLCKNSFNCGKLLLGLQYGQILIYICTRTVISS